MDKLIRDINVLVEKHADGLIAVDQPEMFKLLLRSALLEAYEKGFYHSHNAAMASLNRNLDS